MKNKIARVVEVESCQIETKTNKNSTYKDKRRQSELTQIHISEIFRFQFGTFLYFYFQILKINIEIFYFVFYSLFFFSVT